MVGYMVTPATLVLVAGLCTLSQSADPAPEGVRVYAMTFTKLLDNGMPYYSIMTSAPENGAVRLNVPFASVSEYTLLRSTNSWSSSYTTNTHQFANTAGNGITDRGAIVVTEGNVSVVGSAVYQASGDSYSALPLTLKSKTFYIPAYPTMNTGPSFFAIAAASTVCLEVNNIVNGQFKLRTSMQLNKGEVYQEHVTNIGDDVTGLYITSSAPIAVFSGHECAQNPTGVLYCDHMIEQIPAVDFWGSTSVVPPMGGRIQGAGYSIRVVASQDTQINFPYNKHLIQFDATNGCSCLGLTAMACSTTCQISKGQFVKVLVTNALVPVTVVCTVPCLVTQYGRSYAVVTETFHPDPYMSVITPTDHYSNKMAYSTPLQVDDNGNGLTPYVNYLGIVVLTADRAGLLLDGSAVSVSGIVQGDYTVITLPVQHGYHIIQHSDTTKKIGAFAYGHSEFAPTGTTSSYGFPVSYEIDDITIPGDWAPEIAVPAGVVDPDIPTVVPRTCIRTVDSSNYLPHDVTIRGVDVEAMVSACFPLLTQAKLTTLKNVVNQAICDSSICPSAPDDLFVNSLTTQLVDGVVHLVASFNTNYDTVLSSVFECRVHTVDYLRRINTWATVLTSSELATCNGVISTMERIGSEWMCPGPSVS